MPNSTVSKSRSKYASWVLAIASVFCFQCKHSTEVPTSTPPQTPEVEMLSDYIEANPENPTLRVQRGEQYLREENYDAAIADFNAALSMDSLNIDAWHLLADGYLDNIQSRKALETMETATEIFPDSIRSFLKLTEFRLILRQYDDAMQSIQSIQTKHPNNPDAFFLKGMILKESGDTTGAIQQFQLATREDPFMIDAWINAAQLLESIGDPEAIRYYDAALSINPNHINLLHAKAQYLAHQDATAESIATYQRIISIDPDYSYAYYDIGLLYLDQDSIGKAFQHFDIAIKTEPMFARAYFYRGLTREIEGDLSMALQDFEQAVRLDPDDSDAEEAIQRVKPLL